MNIQGNILEANGFLSFGERFGLTSNLPTCNTIVLTHYIITPVIILQLIARLVLDGA